MTISEVPAPSGGTDLSGRVAAEVRAWMARRRLTATKAAEMMGTSSAYLYRRLNGETALDMNDLDRLAVILDVSVVSLLPAQERVADVTLQSSQTSAPVEVSIGRAA